jgi:hypothetical protein
MRKANMSEAGEPKSFARSLEAINRLLAAPCHQTEILKEHESRVFTAGARGSRNETKINWPRPLPRTAPMD